MSAINLPSPVGSARGSKSVCIPYDKDSYNIEINNTVEFRKIIDELIITHPEIFPADIADGYHFDGFQPESRKTGIRLRRIIIRKTGAVYIIRPSFVLPYMVGFTDDAEKALFLRRYDIPYHALTYVFGRNDMYWYRLETAFGRNSIAGTTVKKPEALPKDLVCDEKHTKAEGKKVFIATTTGKGCISGAAVAPGAGEGELTDAYEVFREEALNIAPEYRPETVNTDGWEATGKSWMNLFPGITIILCFFHAFLSIKRKCLKKFGNLCNEIGNRVWDIFKAENKSVFGQRVRRLREWSEKNIEEGALLSKIRSLCDKRTLYGKWYDHPGAYRTGNMADRLMRRQDEFLFNRQYFHGDYTSAESAIRAWAILRNFQPYCPRTVGRGNRLISAAEKLNGFRYRDNWLENLLVSASMGGYRS